MKRMVRQTYVGLAIAGALAIVWPNSALGINDEEQEWLQAQYDEYFSERFGEPGDRPPDDILEKRCIYEIKQATGMIPFNAYFREHYVKVAKLWAKCATVNSLPTLVDALKVSRRLNTSPYMLHGYVMNANERSTSTLVTWHLLWPELSETWFGIKRAEGEGEDYHKALTKALTRSGAQVEPRLLMDRIVAAEPEIRKRFYEQLLDKDSKLRSDLSWPLRKVIWPQPNVTNSKAIPPTRKELIAMLKSGKPMTTKVALDYAATYEASDLAREMLVKDLQAADEYYRFLEAMSRVFILLRSQRNGLDDEAKAEMFQDLNKRLQELEQLHDQGESIGADSKGDGFDYQFRPLGYERLRIPLVIKAFLNAPKHSGARPVTDAPVFKSHREAFKQHFDWLEHAIEELPEDIPTEAFDNTGTEKDGKGDGSRFE